MYEHHAVGHLARKPHLVRHHDHGHPVARQITHRLKNLTDQLRVECRGRLVEQHDVGFHRECTCDRHALFLASGQANRVLLGLLHQADSVEQLHRPLRGLLSWFTFDRAWSLDDVLDHREMREEVELLKDHSAAFADLADHLPPGAQSRAHLHAKVTDLDHSARRLFEEVDAAKKGGLARAGSTEQNHDLATLDGEGYLLEHM